MDENNELKQALKKLNNEIVKELKKYRFIVWLAKKLQWREMNDGIRKTD